MNLTLDTSFSKIAVCVVSVLLLGFLGNAVFVDAGLSDPDPISSVTDEDGTFEDLTLEGARSVSTVVIDGSTYAVVASRNDNGIQIINMTDPANPIPISSIVDDNANRELAGASSVTTVSIGTNTYAVVASRDDNGIQIINISDPANPIPISSIDDGGNLRFRNAIDVATVSIGTNTYAVTASRNDGIQFINMTDPMTPEHLTIQLVDSDSNDVSLQGLRSVTTAVIDGYTYAIVAVDPENFDDDGIQIINMTDPVNPVRVSVVTDIVPDTMLITPFSVTTTVIGTNTYAVVASQGDDAIQIIDITTTANPDPIFSVTDITLDGASSVTTRVIDGDTYAIVASQNYDAIQFINMTDPLHPTLGSPIRDGSVFAELDGAFDVTTTIIDGRTYAIVASSLDDGIQIVDITNPESPTAASSVDDKFGQSTELAGAFFASTTVIGENTYAVVAGNADDGIQIIDITTPSVPITISAISDQVGGFTTLDGARSVSTVTIDGSTYAIVASRNDNGIQIIDMSIPATPVPVSAVTNTTTGFVLDGPRSVSTVTIDGSTYAVVANSDASSVDGIEIIDITTPSTPNSVSFVEDNASRALNGTISVTTVVIGDYPYAIAASQHDDGIQIINITNPDTPEPISSVTDTDQLTLNGSRSVTTVSINDNTYAVVGSEHDNGIQIIDITTPAAPEPISMIPDGSQLLLAEVYSVTTAVIDGDTYAIAASHGDDGIQIINMTDPTTPVRFSEIEDADVGIDVRLERASSVTTVVIDGRTYALATSIAENGIQLLDITEDTPPTVLDASTASTTTIRLLMSEPVTDDSVRPGDFRLAGIASNPDVVSVMVSPDDTSLILTLSDGDVIASDDDSITISYTQSAGNINDLFGNSLGNIGTMSVTNTLVPHLVTITADVSISDPVNLDTIPFTVSFTVPVTGLGLDDITASFGTVENLRSTPSLQDQFGSFGSENGMLKSPRGIAVNSTGFIFVADTDNHRIQIFNSSGGYQDQFGQSGSQNGSFSLPQSMVFDAADNLYVADTNNHRIQVFDSSGVYQGKFGQSGDQNGNFSSPQGIAINSTGHIFVADTVNNRIQIFDAQGAYQDKFGQRGDQNGNFSSPLGIAINSTGFIYVADTNNARIQIFDSSGVHQGNIAQVSSAEGDFGDINDLEFDSADNLYVADTGNERIYIFDSLGRYNSYFDDMGDDENLLFTPAALAINSTGFIHVADSDGDRMVNIIKIFSPDTYSFDVTGFDGQEDILDVQLSADAAQSSIGVGNAESGISVQIDTVAPSVLSATVIDTMTIHLAISEFVIDNSTVSGDFTIGGFTSPNPPTAVDSITISGDIITLGLTGGMISDTDKEITVSYTENLDGTNILDGANNPLGTFAGLSVTNPLDFTAPLVELQLGSDDISNPTNLETIPFIVSFNEPVTGFELSDVVISPLGTTLQNLEPTLLHQLSFGKLGNQNGNFTAPNGIAINSSGHIFVADQFNHRIQIFDAQGVYQDHFGGGLDNSTDGRGDNEFEQPHGIAINSTDHIFVADTNNHRIQIFNSSNVYQDTIGGDTPETFGTIDGEFQNPRGIAINSTGFIYVTDTLNNRIQIFDSSGGYLDKFGDNNPDASVPGVFNFPFGIAINSTGFVYVTDTVNNRVQIFDSSGGYQDHIGGGTTNNAPGTSGGEFVQPAGIAFDSDDNFYVSDGNNHRIQIFNSSNAYQSHIGGGTTNNTAGTDDGQFNQPIGIAVTPANHVYIADSQNNRVQVFDSNAYSFEITDLADQTTFEVQIRASAVQDIGGGLDNENPSNIVSIRTDRIAPSIVTTAISAVSPLRINIELNEAVTNNNVEPSDFTVTVNGDISSYVVETVTMSIDGTVIMLGLADDLPLLDTDTITVSYTANTGTIDDLAGNLLASFAAQAVTNNVATGGPVITLSTDVTSPTNLLTIPIDVSFDRPINGFGPSNITTSFGDVQNLVSTLSHQFNFGKVGVGEGNFTGPQGIAINSSGFIFVADTSNNRIQIFNSSGGYQDHFGGSGPNNRDEGSGDNEFRGPVGIAINSTDHIFVADTGNNRIQIFNSSNVYQDTIGVTSSTGSTDDGKFDDPYDIAINSTGHIFVTELAGKRVQVFNSSNIHQYHIDNNDIPTELDRIDFDPVGIAINSTNHIFVADTGNNRIQIFNSSGGHADHFDISTPLFVSSDSADNIYVSGIDHISVFDNTNTLLYMLGGGTGSDTFMLPSVIAQSNSTGLVYIADSSNNRIQVFGLTNSTFEIVNLPNRGTLTVHINEDTVQDAGGFSNTDTSNQLSIEIDNMAPTILSAASVPIISDVAIPDTPPRATLSLYSGVSDPTNLVTIPFDVSFDEPVIGFESDDIDTSSGDVLNPEPIFSHQLSFGELGTQGGNFNDPYSVAINSSGHIFVVDRGNHRIQIFDNPNEDPIHIITGGDDNFGPNSGEFTFPSGIAINSTGHIFVADTNSHRIQIFDSLNVYQDTIGGGNVDGSTPGSTNEEFDSPVSIAINSSGHIFVADRNNNRIQIFDSSNIWQHTLGGGEDHDDFSDGAEEEQFIDPSGIAINSTGHIFVADRNNNRIQVFDSSGGYLAQFSNGLSAPTRMTFDLDNNLYVADTGNSRILIFDSTNTPRHGTMGTVDGVFSAPSGVTFDSTNDRLYIADTGNDRVQVFDPSESRYAFNVFNPNNRESLVVSIRADTVQDANGTRNPAPSTDSVFVDRTVVRFTSSTPAIADGATATGMFTLLPSSAPAIADGATTSNPTRLASSTPAITDGATATGMFTLSPSSAPAIADGTTSIPTRLASSTPAIADTAIADTPITTTLSLGPEVSQPTTLSTIPFVVSFSKDIDGFIPSDISHTSGMPANLVKHVTSLPPTTHQVFGEMGMDPTDPTDLDLPYGVAVNSTGHIFVADSANNRIRIFNSSGGHVGQIGAVNTGIDGGFDNRLFDDPRGVAVNSTDYIFVSDLSNHRIQIFNSSNDYQDTIGTSNIAGSTNNHFNNPVGITINSTNHIFVADSDNQRIQIFNSSNVYRQTIGVTGSEGDGVSQFNSPEGIAVNSSGYIFVADTDNDRISVFDSSGNPVTQFDNTGGLNNPRSIAIGSEDNIYVADTENHRISVFDDTNALQFHIGRGNGDGTSGTGDLEFSEPTGVFIDPTDNRLYVADSMNHRIQVINLPSVTHYTFDIVNPDRRSLLDVSIPANVVHNVDDVNDFNLASDIVSVDIDATIALPASSTPAISDEAIIVGMFSVFASSTPVISDQVTTDTILSASSTPAIADAATTGTPITTTLELGPEVSQPTTLGTIPFVVSFSKDIDVFTRLDISHTSGRSDNVVKHVISLPPTTHLVFGEMGTDHTNPTHLNTPSGVAVNSTGHIFVVDSYNNRVRIFNSSGGHVGQIGAIFNGIDGGTDNNHFDNPRGIAINSTDYVFVSDFLNNRIQIFNSSNHYQHTIGINLPNGIDNFGATNDRLHSPTGITINSTNHIFVADSDNQRIQIFNSSNVYQQTIGVTGSEGDGVSQFNSPEGVAVNSSGHIFVADTGNNRISVFDSSGNPVTRFDNTRGINDPKSIAIDSENNIYVADTENHRISVFDDTNALQFHIGRGNGDGTSGTGDLEFHEPRGVFIDPTDNRLYVADSMNHRIQVINLPSVTHYTFDIVNPIRGSLLDVSIPANVVHNVDDDNDYNLASDIVSVDIDATIALPASSTPAISDEAIIVGMFSVFASSTPVIEDTISTSDLPPPVAVSALDDAENAAYRLGQSVSVSTIVIDGSIYAVSASRVENGIQITNITNPTDPMFVSTFDTNDGAPHLARPWSVTTAHVGGNPYALVASRSVDGGFTIIDIRDPTSPTLASEKTDGDDDPPNSFDRLGETTAVSVVDIGGTSYALVGSTGEDSIHVVDISTPTDPNVVSTITHGGDFLLNQPRSISTVIIDGTLYAIVASFDGDSLQILDMSNPADPTHVSNLVDNADRVLDGPHSVDTFIIDNSLYAVAASERDNGIQILNITDDIALDPISNITSTDTDHAGDTLTALEGARFVDTVSIKENTYAVVAGRAGNGIQIIDITNPFNPVPAHAVFDGEDGFTELDGPFSVDIVDIHGNTYVIVASIDDNGIQIIDLVGAPAATLFTDVSGSTNQDTISFTVSFSEPVMRFDIDTDVAVSSGMVQEFRTIDEGIRYAFNVVNPTDGTLQVHIPASAVKDEDELNNTPSNQSSIIIDNQNPTVLSASASIGTRTTIILQMSEPVTVTPDVVPADFGLGGVVSTSVIDSVELSAQNNTQIILTLTGNNRIAPDDSPMINYTRTAGFINDTAGNALDDIAQEITVDTDTLDFTPAVTRLSLGEDVDNPTNLVAIPFTVSFSKPVNGFVFGDITPSSGTVQGFAPEEPFLYARGSQGSGDNQFNAPRGIATNSTGHIFVADTGNNRLNFYDNIDDDNTYVTDLDTEAVNPYSIVVASDPDLNRLFVTDRDNHIIGVYNAETRLHIISLNPSGTLGDGDNQFNAPEGLGVSHSNNKLLVADTGNNRIHIRNGDNGNYEDDFGTEGDGDGQFRGPVDVAANSTGHIYVADTGNNRIQIFDSAGVYLSEFDGTAIFSGGSFNEPRGIAFDSQDNLYVADFGNDRVLVFDNTNTYLYSVSNEELAPDAANRLDGPRDVAVDLSTDTLHILNHGNHRFLTYSIPATDVYTFNVTGATSSGATLRFSIPAGAAQDNNGVDNAASNEVAVQVVLDGEGHFITVPDAPTITDGATVTGAFTLSASSEPTISDTAQADAQNTVSASSIPAISDGITTSLTRLASSEPIISDTAQADAQNTVSASSIPAISDGITTSLTRLASSEPTISDTAQADAQNTLSASSIPAISDAITTSLTRLASSTPTVSDDAVRTIDNILDVTDTPIISDDVTTVSEFTRSASSTPTISDSGTAVGMFTLLASSTPTISDSSTSVRMTTLSASSTPTISDSSTSVRMSTLSVSNIPTISDTAIVGSFTRLASSTPAITDSVAASGMFSLSASSTPAISDNSIATGMFTLLASTTPTISDGATASGMFSLSASSTPAISDNSIVTGMFTLLASTTPTISDDITTAGMFSLSASSTPVLSDGVAASGMFSLSASTTPTITDGATASGMFSLLASSTPTITDSGSTASMFSRSASTTPTISDSGTATGMFSLLASTTPTVSDGITTVASFTRSASTTPTVSDSVRLCDLDGCTVTTSTSSTPAISDGATISPGTSSQPIPPTPPIDPSPSRDPSSNGSPNRSGGGGGGSGGGSSVQRGSHGGGGGSADNPIIYEAKWNVCNDSNDLYIITGPDTTTMIVTTTQVQNGLSTATLTNDTSLSERHVYHTTVETVDPFVYISAYSISGRSGFVETATLKMDLDSCEGNFVFKEYVGPIQHTSPIPEPTISEPIPEPTPEPPAPEPIPEPTISEPMPEPAPEPPEPTIPEPAPEPTIPEQTTPTPDTDTSDPEPSFIDRLITSIRSIIENIFSIFS